jgi:hypothetical protein
VTLPETMTVLMFRSWTNLEKAARDVLDTVRPFPGFLAGNVHQPTSAGYRAVACFLRGSPVENAYPADVREFAAHPDQARPVPEVAPVPGQVWRYDSGYRALVTESRPPVPGVSSGFVVYQNARHLRGEVVANRPEFFRDARLEGTDVRVVGFLNALAEAPGEEAVWPALADLLGEIRHHDAADFLNAWVALEAARDDPACLDVARSTLYFLAAQLRARTYLWG